MKKIIFTFSFLVFHYCNAQGLLAKPETGNNYFPVKANNIIAVIGAFETEVQLLRNEIINRKEEIIEGIHFYTGELQCKKIVLARVGIGKVNAAITTTLLLEHFRPKAIIFSGIAGAMNSTLTAGDIVIGKQLAYHDYGRMSATGFEKWSTQNPYNFNKNPLYFPCDSILVSIAEQAVNKVHFNPINEHVPKVISGTIITGDIFLADRKKNIELRNSFNADAVEMEGASIAQVCFQQKVPFVIIRSLSDSADDSATLDFVKFGKAAAENSAQLVLRILELLK